jgi:hypothetical protein
MGDRAWEMGDKGAALGSSFMVMVIFLITFVAMHIYISIIQNNNPY